ncbi:MAG: hypothetical protein IPN90_08110 [Elusimicrobia bacterium]|nr:hypothetical protein [Elusimicrobiota bacterium]
MIDRAKSKNGVSIRLTDERWTHVVEEHSEMAGLRREVLETITDPSMILEGQYGVLMAIREIQKGKYLVVVFRESGHDGFIITSFMTRRERFLGRRKKIWPA